MSEHHIDFKQDSPLLEPLTTQSFRNEALKRKKIRQRKKIALGLLSLILIGLASFGFLYPSVREYLDRFFHKKSSEVEWDGPSLFKTKAQHFNLDVSGDGLSGIIEVRQGPVDQVELTIDGTIFYGDNSKVPFHQNSLVKDEDTLHRGLHIKIKETDDDFIADIILQEEGDDGTGTQKPVSALLKFTIVFPESYKTYQSLSISARTSKEEDRFIDILIAEDLVVEFKTLGIQADTGSILARNTLVTETLVSFSYHGSTFSGIKAAPGKSLEIHSKTDSLALEMTVLTTPLNDAEADPHSVYVSSKSGNVILLAYPDLSSITELGASPAKVNIEATSKTGFVDVTVDFEDDSQHLSLYAKSYAGNVFATISDKLAGSLELKSEKKSVNVLPKKGSESEIVYEEKTSTKIFAHKTLPSGSRVQNSDVFLTSKDGHAELAFV
ncbi:hypothetical protein BGW38_003763 [Lunasporangiospora selenospora]|uniref:Uncharacterized protein n=1 Tax=Lunasporangiospora selenospora TaxID=979761 RepID=A0A9P6G0G7_9FUNG|nr:hypothetical protein BGW38_003763 [Lunasporangiospora selenospora]